jgi:hypothetical protein
MLWEFQQAIWPPPSRITTTMRRREKIQSFANNLNSLLNEIRRHAERLICPLAKLRMRPLPWADCELRSKPRFCVPTRHPLHHRAGVPCVGALATCCESAGRTRWRIRRRTRGCEAAH